VVSPPPAPAAPPAPALPLMPPAPAEPIVGPAPAPPALVLLLLAAGLSVGEHVQVESVPHSQERPLRMHVSVSALGLQALPVWMPAVHVELPPGVWVGVLLGPGLTVLVTLGALVLLGDPGEVGTGAGGSAFGVGGVPVVELLAGVLLGWGVFGPEGIGVGPGRIGLCVPVALAVGEPSLGATDAVANVEGPSSSVAHPTNEASCAPRTRVSCVRCQLGRRGS
jgi:hypothetical protein